MKPRYKDRTMQRVYAELLALAADPRSELYLKDGSRHRGAGHRCAFWDGVDGKRTANVVPGTLSWACWQAGREHAKRQR